MLNRDALTQAGIDVDEALERDGEETLLERVMGMYLDDTHFDLSCAMPSPPTTWTAPSRQSTPLRESRCPSTKPLFELANKQLSLFREDHGRGRGHAPARGGAPSHGRRRGGAQPVTRRAV